MSNNGIVVDLNRVTRREFRAWVEETMAANQARDGRRADELTGEFAEKVIVSWPYPQPITKDGYLNLALGNSQVVDKTLTEAIISIGEKKV